MKTFSIYPHYFYIYFKYKNLFIDPVNSISFRVSTFINIMDTIDYEVGILTNLNTFFFMYS